MQAGHAPNQQQSQKQTRKAQLGPGQKKTKNIALWSALSFIGLCFFSLPDAHAGACQGSGKTVAVKVTANYGRVVVNRDNTYAELKGKLEENSAGLSTYSEASRVIGLTRWRLSNRVTIFVASRRGADGKSCYWLSSAKLGLKLGVFNVDVAREIPKGSCKYRTTMDHELTHVRLTRRQVMGSIEGLELTLQGAAETVKPILAESSKRAARQFLDALSSELAPALTDLQQRINAANMTIDTPENYRAEQALCGGSVG